MPLTCRPNSSSSLSLIHKTRSSGSQTSTTRTSYPLRISAFHHSLYPRTRKTKHVQINVHFVRSSVARIKSFVLNGLQSRDEARQSHHDAFDLDTENGDEHYRLRCTSITVALLILNRSSPIAIDVSLPSAFVGVHICVDTKSQAATMIDTTLLDVS